jgi:hypothetical protein
VGDVNVSCLISDVCPVARGSTIFMENINFEFILSHRLLEAVICLWKT